MAAPLTRIELQTFMVVLSLGIIASSTAASDELSLPSRPSSVRISVSTYERIPIATLLAHPDRYQMRDIRITGTVMAIQTETIMNRMICGSAHERTVLTLEDDSGQIEVIDRGACGKNMSTLKAPMVKVGERIDLLTSIMTTRNPESRQTVVETAIRYLDRVRY